MRHARVRKMDALVGEIATASDEQSGGIAEVNTAVLQMDKVTQANAARADDAAGIARELNAEVDALIEAVRQLQSLVGGSVAGDRHAPPAARIRSTASADIQFGAPAAKTASAS